MRNAVSSLSNGGKSPASTRVIADEDNERTAGTSRLHGEFSGPEAADLAGVSYRQLDYWARQQWILPSRVSQSGVQRRVYSTADVIRLAALGHLGRSRVDVAAYGAATGRLQMPTRPGFVIVWAVHQEAVRLTRIKDLRRVVCGPGRYIVFDPAPLLRELALRAGARSGPRPRRRTFTNEYKLGVLAEYEGLSEPGAKTSLLRREGLHTSHLVAWRRNREAGALTPSGPPQRRSWTELRHSLGSPTMTETSRTPTGAR